MTPEEMIARVLYRDGLMLVVDKPPGIAVHRGPKGGGAFEDYFDALRYGLPRLEEGQREVWTPQQLGLDRLNGYSVKKGCYPGQEIVACTHFLGKAKRAVQLLHTAAPAQAGDGVQQDGAGLGTIASVAGDLALAVLPLEASDADLQVGDAIAQRVPLLDGLAR